MNALSEIILSGLLTFIIMVVIMLMTFDGDMDYLDHNDYD